jgi:glycosyltransferase involved in cell wall biosynthesis
MKVLMISGDKHLLDPNTGAGKRLLLQRGVVDQLDVVVWPQLHSTVHLYRMALKNKYDVITVQDPFWRGVIGIKCAWLSGAKLNVQVHTDLEAHSRFKRCVARFVLRRANSIRVVSEKIKPQVGKIGTRAPMYVLPVFVDTEKFKHIVRRPRSNPVLLWVGRFEEEKDPVLAVKVAKKVREKIPLVTMIMVGNGTLMDEVTREANNGPIQMPIEQPGWQTDLIMYYEQANVVLCTSKYESWGASIVEALAAGIPVVAPDVGIAEEYGAKVVPREKLAEAVIEVLNNKEQGHLKNISTYSASEWAQKWKESLV